MSMVESSHRRLLAVHFTGSVGPEPFAMVGLRAESSSFEVKTSFPQGDL